MIAPATTRWVVMVRYFDEITGQVTLVRRNVEARDLGSASEKALSTIPDGVGDVLFADPVH